jgi:hypothetical protein
LIYLQDGKLDFEGSVADGMGVYNETIRLAETGNSSLLKNRNIKNKRAFISGFNVKMSDDNNKMQVCINAEALQPIEKAEIAIGINDSIGTRIITFHSRFMAIQFNLERGLNEFVCTADNFFLKPGFYSMNIFLGNKYETLDYIENPLAFEIEEYPFYPANLIPDNTQGSLMANHQWTMKTADHARN